MLAAYSGVSRRRRPRTGCVWTTWVRAALESGVARTQKWRRRRLLRSPGAGQGRAGVDKGDRVDEDVLGRSGDVPQAAPQRTRQPQGVRTAPRVAPLHHVGGNRVDVGRTLPESLAGHGRELA